MKTITIPLWLAAMLAVVPLGLAQQNGDPPARELRATRLTELPTIDGLVTEAFWQDLDVATDFIQQNPDEGQVSAERTEIRVGFDDRNVYIGIICFDSQPENIVVTQNRRDADLVDTDSVQIILDTFDDDQNAFIFGTSPTGVEFDGQVSKAGQTRGGGGGPARAGGGGGGAQRGGAAAFNLNWDGVWSVRAQITERGWESEIAIPFRTLRFKPGAAVWGMNVMRNLRRRNELSYWSPISRAFQFTQVSLAGSLSGLETRTQRNLKLLPYVLGGFSQDYNRVGDQTKFERDVGLDVKYSLTPSVTLDATVNTDFAQVEVDDEQVNLTRFDLFFPEKRSFFLENSGFFEFGTPEQVEIFFSRRIGLDEDRNPVPIDVGARISGKAGPYQIGLLSMQTRSVDGAAPANNYSVARFSRELPNRSSIGVIGVNRQATTDFEDKLPYNRTFGADANIGIGQFGNWFNYVAKTQTPGITESDHAYSSRFEYDDSRHEFHLGYLEVGHNFNPEVGFVQRAGFKKPEYFYRYTHYLNGGPIRSIEPHVLGENWLTLGTNRKESGFEHYHIDSRWQNGGRLGVAFNRNFERLDLPFEVHPGIFIPVGGYQFNETIANFGTDPSATLSFSGSAASGDFYDGSIRSLRGSLGYRKGRNLTWTGSWARNFIELPVGDFNTDLMGLRFNWSFTPKSFFQTFSQYNSRTEQIGHNVRLGLLSTSSTGLYVVFNTANLTRDYLDPHDAQRRTLSRALFVKFNYLLDY
ncbi:MAG: DUF5916 domain-containing protein [Acidobacteria bacterium]|nr:DUF5916 domain-containing protein [Acidobacteriota bacterium]